MPRFMRGFFVFLMHISKDNCKTTPLYVILSFYLVVCVRKMVGERKSAECRVMRIPSLFHSLNSRYKKLNKKQK